MFCMHVQILSNEANGTVDRCDGGLGIFSTSNASDFRLSLKFESLVQMFPNTVVA